MWRNIRFPYITDVEKSENSPHLSCEKCQISPHDRFVISFITKKINNVYSLWSFVAFYVTSFCKNYFFANYAVLSRNLFVAIYAFLCGEKLSPKLYMWRKNDKYQVCVRQRNLDWYQSSVESIKQWKHTWKHFVLPPVFFVQWILVCIFSDED